MSFLKNILFVLSVGLIGGCVADLVKTEEDSLHQKTYTIKYFTGSLLDDGTYSSAFKNKAEKLCGNDQYEVTERGRKPSTLKGMETEDYDFYWVVKCK